MLEPVKKTILTLGSIGVSLILLEIGATFLLPQPQIIIDQARKHPTGDSKGGFEAPCAHSGFVTGAAQTHRFGRNSLIL
jgi:hypothetical protein